MKSIQYDINKQDFMTLRPFNINDAPTILNWCKDKHAFRLWCADRYKDYPAKPEEMMEQYNSNNMYPLTAVVDNLIIGHILLRYPSASRCYVSLSIMQSINWVFRRLLWGCSTTTPRPFIATSR